MSSWLWLPWVATVSAVLAVGAVLAWRRGRRGSAVRWLGWALVPWAAWLLGLVTLVARVTDAASDWLAGFVFRPTTWAGFAVAAVALVLISLGTRLAKKRSEAPATKPLAPTSASGDDDIEALLRKHGIN